MRADIAMVLLPFAVLAVGLIVLGIAWWGSKRDERRAPASNDGGAS